MKIQNEEKFIKGVESLINPMAVSNLLFFQSLKCLLPPKIMMQLLYWLCDRSLQPVSVFQAKQY